MGRQFQFGRKKSGEEQVMRIAIVGRGVPLPGTNNPGIFEFDQAKALAAAGQDVVYLAVDLRSLRRKRRFGVTHGELDGVPWHNISWPVGAVPMGLLCRIGGIAARHLFRKVFRDQARPDVIHAHFGDIGCMAAYVAREEHIPLVVTEHFSAMNNAACDPALVKYAKVGYEAADRVIAVSSILAESIRKKTGIKCCVVPNVISTADFSTVSRRDHEGFGYVVTGSLIERKRQTAVLRAFAAVHARHRDAFLGVIGDGPDRRALEETAKELGIAENVRFYGNLSRSEIARAYTGCDCFVLPSALETFGVVYAEALAAGLPVIATRCGGPEDFVTEQNGLLIDVDDPAQLERAMEYMYGHAADYDSQAVRGSAERFSPGAVAGELVHIYTGLVPES